MTKLDGKTIATQGLKIIRESGILVNWEDNAIFKSMFEAIKNGAFAFTAKDGCVDGICFGQWKDEETLHVSCVVGKLKTFVGHLKSKYPNIKYITAFRKRKGGTYTPMTYEVIDL